MSERGSQAGGLLEEDEGAEVTRGDSRFRGGKKRRGEEAAVWAEEKKEWLLRSCLPGAETGRRVGLLSF